MDLGRYRVLLALLAIALAVVSVRQIKARRNSKTGYIGLLAVAILLAMLLWSTISG